MDSNVPVNVTTPSVVAEVAITYPEYGAVMSCDLIKQATGMAIVDINELQNNLRKVFSSGRNLPAKSHGVRESVPKKMANPRVAKFKRFQRLFRSNRRKLASHIFDKASLEQFGGSIDEASDHLEKFLSHPRLESDLYSAISGDNSIGIAHPILAEEVELELKATRPTAVGPDGIALEDIKRLNPYDIASLFNLWLKAGDLPDSVKASRTIFLPKSDGTTDISNCRPITIASALYRLFSKIITRRLAAKLELNVRQKAFQSEINGVFENTAILYALIKDAKVRSKEICITTLDLAKAFDTVPHSRIIRALRKNNVDPESVDLISKMLTGTTYAEIKGLKGKPIIIRNGVRQGDPLSPLLFEKGSLVNSWLRGTSGMRSRDYITGLKMRHCGRSSGHRETAADVAQKCLVTQALIIQRHNKIVRLSGDEVYKPDLILIKDDTAHIIDVVVPWKKGTNMHERHERKTNKYAQLIEDVKALFGVQTCTVGVLVIGARSSWCPSNDGSLKACGLVTLQMLFRLSENILMIS
ncbi:Retrovirus-related Pol polyprotein from type-1 retrotransposable element [Trichinella sp. T6]|nr:Retrovirus-related Pol polyprotein from type-1 retrotransposable element [Trichinella sp. T6]